MEASDPRNGRSNTSSLRSVPVILDVGLGAQNVGDLFLGSRSDSLVVFELGNRRLVSGGNVFRRGMFDVRCHG